MKEQLILKEIIMDTKPKGKTLDETIERALVDMEDIPVESEEYLAAAKAVEVLCQARSHKKETSIKGIPIEAVVAAGANILGILLVLNYERANVITTKAFGMIFKGRNI
jgi:hypothetical protein